MGLLTMRRSKLEIHVDILTAVAHHGPLSLTRVMYKTNVSCSILKYYVDFLIQQNLVEKQTLHKKRVVYVITERGQTVLKFAKELYNVLPIWFEGESDIPPLLY